MTQRLSALDASFLAMETPTTPMHVGSLSIFEGTPLRDEHGRIRIDELRALTDERLHLVPRMRQKVMPTPLGLGRPVWVDDPDFDIAYHINVAMLPAPGTDEQLRRLCEHLHMQLLDRSRPLWEIWIVDGLIGDRVAVIEKLHHCMVDGVSSVDIATATLDLTAEVQRYDAPRWEPLSPPRQRDLIFDDVKAMVAEPAGAMLRMAKRGLRPRDTVKRLRHLAGGAATLTRAPLTPLAPKSSLNRPIGRRRRLEAVHVPLPEVKAAGRQMDATVNDMVMAAVAGGLRSLLLGRGERIDGLVLHALVPVSLRSDDQHLALGNQVTALLAPLPVGVDDPRQRLDVVRAGMRDLKNHDQAQVTAAALAMTEHWPTRLASVVSRLVKRQPFVNLVVTNVPGPPFPLFMGGARMLETVPIVPLGGNLDVAVGIVSYDGDLCLGLYADAETCDDVGVLAEGIEKSFVELRHLADQHGRDPS